MFREILDLMLDTLGDLRVLLTWFVNDLIGIIKRRWND